MLGGSPVPGDSLLSEIEEWASDLGVVQDEIVVVACEAKDLANFGWVLWGFPLPYTVEFAWVHAHLVFPNNDTQVFNFFLCKFTLRRLEVEVIVV